MVFELEARCGSARAGVCHLPNGSFHTPLFMPVGTYGAVKTVEPAELRRIGVEMMLCNGYHLYLRPGVEVVESMGGLRGFTAWDRLVLTDSGGYQIFSLKGMTRVDERGVEFRSHLDGSIHFFTPEECVQLQVQLGADILMALDVCPPYDAPRSEVEEATARTSRWAARCKQTSLPEDRILFGIIQGGVYPDLRKISAEALTALDFSGYAIGGLSIGEPVEKTMEIVSYTEQFLPADRPRYLMGVGMPLDILNAVERGMDMFDCVLPTRMARNGTVFTAHGRVVLRNAKHKKSDLPIDPECDCEVCRTFSRAYLRHLFAIGEINAARLATFHNLYFYVKMMSRIRTAIMEGGFADFKADFMAKYQEGDF